ncbi:MAG: response regulator [Spirochaetia bacterium]|nr:response regulator [Spirochaetia bacterium]
MIEKEPLKILLVEDNRAHANLTMIGLKQSRVENIVYIADDGEDAMDFLRHSGKHTPESISPRPDLVLLDLRLPKINGLELLEEIRRDEKLKDLKVVILTTSDSENDKARAAELHAQDYLVKPDDYPQFTALMDKVVTRWS